MWVIKLNRCAKCFRRCICPKKVYMSSGGHFAYLLDAASANVKVNTRNIFVSLVLLTPLFKFNFILLNLSACDWSVMEENGVSEYGDTTLGPPTLNEDLSNQRLSPSTQAVDGDEEGWRDPPHRHRRSRQQRRQRGVQRVSMEPRATSIAVSTMTEPQAVSALSNSFALLSATAAQRSSHRGNRRPPLNHRPTPPVGRRPGMIHASGAKIGNAYQRQQTHRISGGIVMKGNKVRA